MLCSFGVKASDAARFWAKVDRLGPDECWEWTAYLTAEGYGIFYLDGRQGLAHRAAWRLTHGKIRSHQWVLHACDNKQCVNPAHLSIGTCAENRRQWVERGRKPATGTGTDKPRRRPSAEDRFWPKVDKQGPIVSTKLGPCWMWIASCFWDGYGIFGVVRTSWKAHRFSWQLAHGAIPKGLHCLHRCDNRRCVNPAHLFLGTNTDNFRDKMKKGRQATGARNGARLHPERLVRGDAHWCAKLSAEKVRSSRRLRAAGWRVTRIATKFGVTGATIHSVLRGKTWAHVKA
jgi:hypothetical protein